MSDATKTPEWLVRSLAVAETTPRFTVCGRVIRVIGQVIEVSSLPVAVGEVCRIAPDERSGILAQVAGFHERGILLMPLGELQGVHPGAAVIPMGRGFYAAAGERLVGRVLDGLGRPIDGGGPLGPTRSRPNRRTLSSARGFAKRSPPACARSTGS
jgi:flagellar biosynthesis/type III secretory pathway ATPase